MHRRKLFALAAASTLAATRVALAQDSGGEGDQQGGDLDGALQRFAALPGTKSGVVQIRVTREAGLTLPRQMIAPSHFQRWCVYGPRSWRGSEAARA